MNGRSFISPHLPLFFYEKQAASGRAPAGMSGIFGRRVASSTVKQLSDARLANASAKSDSFSTERDGRSRSHRYCLERVDIATRGKRTSGLILPRARRSFEAPFDRPSSWSEGWTILCRFRTRDRGDSYLRLINYCPYPAAWPLSLAIEGAPHASRTYVGPLSLLSFTPKEAPGHPGSP